MPFEPLRFLHAANLCLDATLQCTIALPADAQAEVEDATLDAFNNLVDACIDRRVDFLLLTGNCFIERDRSLRARLALRDGFRELNEHGIAVFVTPGEHDTSEAWQAIPELPKNVTVCHPSNPEPVAVMRDGKVIATIANNLFYGEADHFGIKSSPTTGDRRPYRIGMLHPARLSEIEAQDGPLGFDDEFDDDEPGGAVEISEQGEIREIEVAELIPEQQAPELQSEVEQTLAAFLRQALVDYAVLTGQVTRRTIRLRTGVAHSPGRTQPLAAADHGKHGATIVDVDTTGLATCRRIPTVTTRWKSIDVHLEHDATAEEIHDRCQELLASEPRERTEAVWLVNWNIVASNSIVQDFQTPGYTDRFAHAIEAVRSEGDPSYVHSFRVFPASRPDEMLGEDLLVSQFNRFASEIQIDEELLQRLIPDGTRDLAWNDRLRSLTSELDKDLIAAHLRRFGGHWFARVGVAEEVGVAAPEAFEHGEQESEGLSE